jgi:quercetin dioxygenase-like cupin family protein
MKILHAGTRPSTKGPDAYFNGTVRIDPVIEAAEPARVRAAVVTFEPGARTAWHTHPLGQTLLIVSGFGRAQSQGGALVELRPGDVVWFAPGEKHWHGASPATAMSHLAIQEAENGQAVTWLEQVADADYDPRP